MFYPSARNHNLVKYLSGYPKILIWQKQKLYSNDWFLIELDEPTRIFFAKLFDLIRSALDLYNVLCFVKKFSMTDFMTHVQEVNKITVTAFAEVAS